jgi:hypothetical protein
LVEIRMKVQVERNRQEEFCLRKAGKSILLLKDEGNVYSSPSPALATATALKSPSEH